MILIKLFWMFFKIGLFSFGGGYAMIPLIQKELQVNGWIQASEFADIVAISQMTPGPVAVNAATYIGAKVAGPIGSAFATFGVSLPSFILVILIAKFFEKFKQNHIVESSLKGIRPVTIGLIGSAVIFFACLSIITVDISIRKFKLNLPELIIFLLVFIGIKKFKIHPILAIGISAVLGIILI